MEKLLLALTAAVAVAFPTASSHADVVTKEVVISVNDVLVPNKISSNDDAKVIVSGMFPNGCYSWSRSEVIERSQTRRDIRAFANVAQTMCIMVLVPYTKEINLGRLQPGEYTLRFINGDETYSEKTLRVE